MPWSLAFRWLDLDKHFQNKIMVWQRDVYIYFFNIKTRFDPFLPFLDTYRVVFSSFRAKSKKCLRIK